MKKLVYILVFIVFFLSSFTELHKFYVSVTQIDYNQEQQSLQVISRIFIDDIEDVFRERYDASIELAIDNESTSVEAYLDQYLHRKIALFVNGVEVSFCYIGKEYDNDLMLCYLEVENIASLETITVSNKVLMDVFEMQQNIIHVKKGKKRKSLILEKEKNKGMLKFSE